MAQNLHSFYLMKSFKATEAIFPCFFLKYMYSFTLNVCNCSMNLVIDKLKL